MQEMEVQSLGREYPREKEMATYSSILAREIPWTEGTRQATVHGIINNLDMTWKWQSTPVLLPGKSHEQRSLVGYSPWGRKESDTTERLHFSN